MFKMGLQLEMVQVQEAEEGVVWEHQGVGHLDVEVEDAVEEVVGNLEVMVEMEEVEEDSEEVQVDVVVQAAEEGGVISEISGVGGT